MKMARQTYRILVFGMLIQLFAHFSLAQRIEEKEISAPGYRNPFSEFAHQYRVSKTFSYGDGETGMTLIVSGKLALCSSSDKGHIILNVLGGFPPYTFKWNNLQTVQNRYNLNAGTYTVWVKDSKGNGIMERIVVQPPFPLIVEMKEIQPASCGNTPNGKASINIKFGRGEPYTIEWSHGLKNALEATDLAPGTYSVKVSDFYQCFQTLSFEIPAGAEGMTIKDDIVPISCSQEKGSISVSIAGGKAPFSFLWSNGKTTEKIEGLEAGSYELTVKDANGCTVSKSFTIDAFTPMEVSAEASLDLSCAESADGYVNLEVQGGKAPFTFSWSNGAKTRDLAGLSAGLYVVTVTDADGCSIEKSFEISAPEKLKARIETMLDVDCSSGETKGVAWVSVQGGKAPYTIKWLNGKQTGNEIEFLEENEISVEITDANGCKVTETKSVNYGQVLSADRLAFEYKKLRKVHGTEIEVLDPLQFESLASEEFIAWEWDFGDGTVSREKDPVHVYETPGQFEIVLKGYDIFGCSSVQKEKISVQESREVILIPNAFTPNGDGLNDTFEPKMKAYSFFRMDIFNTWGELIFSSSQSERIGWDGRVMGQEAPSGSYVFKISLVTDAGETVQESGTLTLIR